MSSKEPNIFDTAAAAVHSAAVQIELFMEGQRFPVGQVGRELLIFDEAVSLPGGEGELVLTIDGHQRRWSVSVQNGPAPARHIKAEIREVG